MILLAGLLDVLFRAMAFVGLALAAGGVAFDAVALRPALGRSTFPAALRRTAALTAFGAFVVAFAQSAALVVAPWALADDESGAWPLADFLTTGFARAGLVHAAAAVLLGLAALRLRARPHSIAARAAAAVFAILALASGGPLTHAASRLVHPLLLMTVTVLHQLPSAVWVGGAVHLAAQWRLLRDQPERDTLWPRLLARFSPLAATCVAALLAAGLYLAWRYVGDLSGLLGTAYGTMLLTKVALTAGALALGAMNLRAVRDWRRSGALAAMRSRVPILVETEAAIGVCVLMAAAAFTGQPPAADIAPADRATPTEVALTFAPRRPQLTMPPFAEMIATAKPVRDAFAPPSELDKVQSNFNHNASGAFVLLAGAAALLWRAGRVRAARHWPLAFVGLGLFVLVIAEPTVWPLGPEPFWATLAAPEVLVHRLAGLLVVALGLFEWRVSTAEGKLEIQKTKSETNSKSKEEMTKTGAAGGRAVFPFLCFAGGTLLLTHSHSAFATKWAFLIEVSHNALGIFAVGAGAARWLDLRLPPTDRTARLAAALWPACLALVGAVLLFYRET